MPQQSELIVANARDLYELLSAHPSGHLDCSKRHMAANKK